MNRKVAILLLVLTSMALGTFSIADAKVAFSLQDVLDEKYGIDLYGFIKGRQGWRLQNDSFQKDTSISEIRTQLDLSKDADWGLIKLKGDLIGDQVGEKTDAQLREFNIDFSPLDFMDIKMGRQTLFNIFASKINLIISLLTPIIIYFFKYVFCFQLFFHHNVYLILMYEL